MNESVYEQVAESCHTLRLDLSSLEFAKLAEEFDFSETQLAAVCRFLGQYRTKK